MLQEQGNQKHKIHCTSNESIQNRGLYHIPNGTNC